MKKLLLALAIIASISCSKKIHSAASSNSLRVMSYNIHHCNPPSKPGLINLDAIASTIQKQNPDLVALQEVDVNTKRSGRFNQAEELAKRLNMKFFFAKAIDHEGGDYGVAILSKFPISETQIFRLPTKEGTKGELRVMTTARVEVPGGKIIRFGSTHLDAQGPAVNRELQIKEINRISSVEKLPFIIAGDFNATPESTIIKQLDQQFTRTCQTCGPTIPVVKPTKAIDFVAYIPSTAFKTLSHEAVQEHYASDHLPVIAVIQVK